jgi:membrane-associated phospholipid phosphatase
MSFILDKLLELDKKLFLIINNDLTSDFLNTVLPFTRNSIFWIPLYLFILIFVLTNFKKTGLFWVLLAVATAAATDIVSSHIIKENIMRLRPCQNPLMINRINFLLNYCPQSSSFTSSHATSHFGFAAFLFFTLRRFSGKWLFIIFLWAAVISYAQVYVGVHYPLDIFCGALVGTSIGFLMAKLFNRYFVLQIYPEMNI